MLDWTASAFTAVSNMKVGKQSDLGTAWHLTLFQSSVSDTGAWFAARSWCIHALLGGSTLDCVHWLSRPKNLLSSFYWQANGQSFRLARHLACCQSQHKVLQNVPTKLRDIEVQVHSTTFGIETGCEGRDKSAQS